MGSRRMRYSTLDLIQLAYEKGHITLNERFQFSRDYIRILNLPEVGR